MTPRQVRAARALLGWKGEVLAAEAGVALTTVFALEGETRPVSDGSRQRIQTALTDAGIVFSRTGVRLRCRRRA